MKTINVRELRAQMPNLKQALADAQELLLVSNGEAIARILPVAAKRHVPSMAAHRARMTPLPAGTLAQALREDRDRG